MHAVARRDPGRRRSRLAPIRQEQAARRRRAWMRQPHGALEVRRRDHRLAAQGDRGAQRRRARQRDPAAVAASRFGRSLPPVRRYRARKGSRRRQLGQRRRILPRSVGTLHSMHAARRADAARLLQSAGRWRARDDHRAQRYRRQADRADSRRTPAQRDRSPGAIATPAISPRFAARPTSSSHASAPTPAGRI